MKKTPEAETDADPSETPTLDLHPELGGIAKICHEANRALCLHTGDRSQVPWDEAPAWQRESAAKGVLFWINAGEGAGPDAGHANWYAHKVAEGWTYSSEKDADAKTHPCMVPFDHLPPDQQLKDKVFRAIVLAAVGPGELVQPPEEEEEEAAT